MQSLRIQRLGWYTYDWANSAFSTSVVTVFLGPYLTSIASAAAGPDSTSVTVLGVAIHPGSWYSYCVSLSVLLQVLFLPPIGALVDKSHRKRFALTATALPGALFTTMLCLISAEQANFVLGGLFFVLANLFFGASIVVANSFLADLASERERDAVSSRGWAFGYLGGGLLLLGHLLWFNSVESAGEPVGPVVRGVFLTTGIWWALFTFVSVALLPKVKSGVEHIRAPIRESFSQFSATLRHMRNYPQTLRFLVAYVLYNEAIQTVLTMASVYGAEELNLGMGVLTQAILLVQFVAIGGSLVFARIAKGVGTRNAIMVGLAGWCFVLVAAFSFVETATHFYVLAAVIAIVMGGTQALSRSYFSQMIPLGKEAEYFSLYEISDKGTSWLGPLAFGVALTLSGSYRWAILSLILFMIAGMALLLRVRHR